MAADGRNDLQAAIEIEGRLARRGLIKLTSTPRSLSRCAIFAMSHQAIQLAPYRLFGLFQEISIGREFAGSSGPLLKGDELRKTVANVTIDEPAKWKWVQFGLYRVSVSPRVEQISSVTRLELLLDWIVEEYVA